MDVKRDKDELEKFLKKLMKYKINFILKIKKFLLQVIQI